MSTSVLRTADAWWVLTDAGAVRVDTSATTTAELLGDAEAVDAARRGIDAVDPDSLELVSPVTSPCRVVSGL